MEVTSVVKTFVGQDVNGYEKQAKKLVEESNNTLSFSSYRDNGNWYTIVFTK